MESDGYLSPLARELAQDALERFLRYARIDTQSAYGVTDRYPSTEKQLDLSRILVDELKELGVEDARLEDAYVYGTLPATADQVPAVGLCAHVDTSPDVSGANVEPQLIRNYEGGDIVLPKDERQVLSPAELPELAERVGHDLVTTDGTTLLGGDDKAGVAEIMASLAYLTRHPELEHGPVKIAFTPDEEVGEGTKHFDVAGFGADACYTVDGPGVGEIDDETFSAETLTVTIHGHSVHPGQAKGKLVNAVKLAADLISRLPKDRLSPETTEGREGYVHPGAIEGGAEQAIVRFLLRDFEEEKLREHERLIRGLVDEVVGAEPRAHAYVDVTRTYSNMRVFLRDVPHVVEIADEAARRAGLEPRRGLIRGGTDGSRLTELGLPTPNIFAAQQNSHSVKEWLSVQDLGAVAATLVELVQVWAERAPRS